MLAVGSLGLPRGPRQIPKSLDLIRLEQPPSNTVEMFLVVSSTFSMRCLERYTLGFGFYRFMTSRNTLGIIKQFNC